MFAGRLSVSEHWPRRRTMLKRTAKACGSGTRGWCQIGGGFRKPNRVCKTVNSPMTEARGIRLRGERAISRKTTAQGMPECSDCTCMLVCASTTISCTRDLGCSKHPAFPAPSCLGRNGWQSPGETRRGKVKVCSPSSSALCAIAHWGGRSSIPETPAIEPIGRGVLDTPPARGMTVGCGKRFGLDAAHRPPE